MNLWLAAGVLAGCIAAMVAVMLLVRARITGAHFKDSGPATSVFGFIGTGFAIILGFVVLLSYEGYSNARSKAEDEATAVFEQYEVAALFTPVQRRDRLWGELVCYARSVIEDEWPAMKSGRHSELTDTWIERLEQEVPAIHITSMTESVAYATWFEKAGERDDARRQRLLEAQNVIPALLWIMLIIGALAVVGFTLLYADPNERALGQAVFIGSITAVVVVSLLAVSLLASPFQGENGSIKPSGMRYTVQLIEAEAAQLGDPLQTPCDAGGKPV